MYRVLHNENISFFNKRPTQPILNLTSALTQFYRIVPSFDRVLPSFSDLDRVESNSTEFYRVLPSFTEFYRVLVSIAGGLTGVSQCGGHGRVLVVEAAALVRGRRSKIVVHVEHVGQQAPEPSDQTELKFEKNKKKMMSSKLCHRRLSAILAQHGRSTRFCKPFSFLCNGKSRIILLIFAFFFF